MIIELTLLWGAVYKGAGLLERWTQPEPQPEPPSTAISQAQALKRLERPEMPWSTADIAHERRFIASTANVGLSVLALANPALAPFVAAGVIYCSFPVLKSAVVSLFRDRTIGNDLLVALSMVTFLGSGYVGIMAIGSWFYYLGSRLQRRVRSHAQLKLSELFLQAPRSVWILRDLVEVAIPVEDVQQGDIVVVRAGEVIPIDGVIAQGQGLLDQHLLTGEAQPAEKDVGDRVLASTVVLAGTIHVKAERTGKDTTTARIAAMIEQTVDHKSSVQLKGERWADQSALPLLATAGAALVFYGPVPSGLVLSSSIGNRMRLLGALGTLTHLNLASSYGFLVKDGRALEQLRSIDTVLFDKTGTLTKNEFVVKRIVAVFGISEHDVLRYAAIAERRQTHPIARTILKKAAELNVTLPDAETHSYHIGLGIAVEYDGILIQVGSARFLRREGVALDGVSAVQQEAQARGHVLVLLAIDRVIAGAIELEPALRPELQTMLRGLRRHGVTLTAIVSGDHEAATRQLADELGVDRFYADVLPESKAAIVAALQKEGRKVCFIGDGVNDSVAMKKADVSISLDGASSFAMDAAQIILMDADVGLANLGRLFDLARDLDRNLRNGLTITVSFVAINLTGALFVTGFGVLPAYFLKQIGLAAGLANAMSPARGRREPPQALPAAREEGGTPAEPSAAPVRTSSLAI